MTEQIVASSSGMTGDADIIELKDRLWDAIIRVAKLERRVKFLENILACPNCYAILENRHSCIFCGWKEQP
jgi:hypothetical protein